MVTCGVTYSYYLTILRDFRYFSNWAKLAPMNKFLIDHIDPLGQGVFKEDGQVYFIPKTLPGESGEFKINKSSKGVNFATCTKLETKSPDRTISECEFFDECNGCHYLHTSYEKEIEFKILSYQKILSNH